MGRFYRMYSLKEARELSLNLREGNRMKTSDLCHCLFLCFCDVSILIYCTAPQPDNYCLGQAREQILNNNERKNSEVDERRVSNKMQLNISRSVMDP
jgi:hypothetical protein